MNDDYDDWDTDDARVAYQAHDPLQGVRLADGIRGGREASYLSVEWLNPLTQEREYLTRLDRDASIETLINAARKPGKFFLYGISAAGEKLNPRDPIVQVIAKDNTLLRDLKEAEVHGVPVPGARGPGGSDPAVTRLLEKQLDAMRDEMNRMRETVAARERALAAKEEQLSKERIALSIENANTSTELHQRAIDVVAKGNLESQSQIATVMSQQMAAQAQAHRLAMEKLEAQNAFMLKKLELDAKSQEQAFKHRLKEEDIRRDRELQDAQLRREQERREYEERMERERRDFEERMERDREWHKARLKEVENQKTSGPEDMIERWAPILSLLGIDLGSLGKLLSGSGGVVDAVAGAVGKAVDGFIEVKKLEIEKGGTDEDEDDDGDELVQVQLPDGRVIVVTKAQLLLMQQQQMMMQQQQQQPMQPGALAAPAVPDMHGIPGGFPQQGMAHPAPAQQAPPQPPPAPQDPRAQHIREKMSVPEQKQARHALRQMVEALQSTPQDEWRSIVMTAVGKAPIVVTYLRLRSIYDAVIEAGGSAGLANKIIEGVEGVVPSDIPRR